MSPLRDKVLLANSIFRLLAPSGKTKPEFISPEDTGVVGVSVTFPVEMSVLTPVCEFSEGFCAPELAFSPGVKREPVSVPIEDDC